MTKPKSKNKKQNNQIRTHGSVQSLHPKAKINKEISLRKKKHARQETLHPQIMPSIQEPYNTNLVTGYGSSIN